MSRLPVIGNIIKDPIGTAATAAGFALGGPAGAGLASGGLSLARGNGIGNALQSGLTSAGTAYLGGKLLNSTGGLSDTALGRGVNDLYQGSLLQDAVQGVSGGVNDLYSGSDLEKLIGTSQDSVSLPGIGKVGMNNGTGLRGVGSSIGNSLSSIASPITSAGISSGSTVPASAAGGGASSVGGDGMFSNLFSKKNLMPALGVANSLYGNAQAQSALKQATNQANEALSPYTGIGSAAASKLAGYLGVNGTPASSQEILAASPGYQFMLDQGNQQLDRSQAARGGFFSGAALKAAQDYASGLANQTSQNYYNQLANTAGLGANAANAFGNNVTALGTAKGAANLNTTNMINQLLAGYGDNPYAKLMGMV